MGTALTKNKNKRKVLCKIWFAECLLYLERASTERWFRTMRVDVGEETRGPEKNPRRSALRTDDAVSRDEIWTLSVVTSECRNHYAFMRPSSNTSLHTVYQTIYTSTHAAVTWRRSVIAVACETGPVTTDKVKATGSRNLSATFSSRTRYCAVRVGWGWRMERGRG